MEVDKKEDLIIHNYLHNTHKHNTLLLLVYYSSSCLFFLVPIIMLPPRLSLRVSGWAWSLSNYTFRDDTNLSLHSKHFENIKT